MRTCANHKTLSISSLTLVSPAETAIKLTMNDIYKRIIAKDVESITPPQRMAAGALAGSKSKEGKEGGLKLTPALAKFKAAALKTMPPKVQLRTLLHLSMRQWREQLETVDTDDLLGDGSINNIIFTKVKEVFAALLDAATLAGSWVIVDRTDGQGSATAELLLEMLSLQFMKK